MRAGLCLQSLEMDLSNKPTGARKPDNKARPSELALSGGAQAVAVQWRQGAVVASLRAPISWCELPRRAGGLVEGLHLPLLPTAPQLKVTDLQEASFPSPLPARPVGHGREQAPCLVSLFQPSFSMAFNQLLYPLRHPLLQADTKSGKENLPQLPLRCHLFSSAVPLVGRQDHVSSTQGCQKPHVVPAGKPGATSSV